MNLTAVTLDMRHCSDVAWQHPPTGCIHDGYNVFGKQIPLWNRRASALPAVGDVERAAKAMYATKGRLGSWDEIKAVWPEEYERWITLAKAAVAAYSPGSESVERMRDTLRAYEQWEADLILERDAWNNRLPTFTDKLWDRFLEIQALRNAALSATPSGGAK